MTNYQKYINKKSKVKLDNNDIDLKSIFFNCVLKNNIGFCDRDKLFTFIFNN